MSKSIFAGLWLIIGSLCSFLLVLCAYSSMLSPETWEFSAFSALLFPIFLLGTLFFLILWSIRLSKRFFIPLAAFLLSLPVTLSYFPIHWGGDSILPPKDEIITVLSYNIHNFGEAKPPTAEHPNPILSYILECDADIVCLQEYSISLNDRHLTEKQIKKALTKYPYYHFMPVNETFYRNTGIACFSKFPIRKSARIPFPASKHNGAIRYELDVDGTPLTLINCHLESNKFTESDKQAYSEMVKNLDTDMISGVGGRLIPKLATAAKVRAMHAEIIAAEAQQTEGDLIICGDFNDVPNSYPYRTLRKGLEDAYVNTGFGPGITYHKNGFWFRIDHLLYGGDLYAFDTRIDRILLSDHYPLFTTLLRHSPAELEEPKARKESFLRKMKEEYQKASEYTGE